MLPFEIIFSLFYIALFASSVATTKFRRAQSFRIYLAIAEAVVVTMLFLDPILASSKASSSGGVFIRFGVPFRPILVILWSGRIKEIISEIMEACRSLKFMAILTLAWLAISSMLLVLNVRGECGYGDGNREYLFPSHLQQPCKTLMRYFDNTLVGIVASFVLLTGEIYSSVTLALFDIPGQSFVFIVVAIWTLISYFVLLALVRRKVHPYYCCNTLPYSFCNTLPYSFCNTLPYSFYNTLTRSSPSSSTRTRTPSAPPWSTKATLLMAAS